MKDFFHSFTNWVDHNRYKALATILITAILVWGIGCHSKTLSLFEPQTRVTRQQFAAETVTLQSQLEQERIDIEAAIEKFNARAQAVNAKIEAGNSDLERQDMVKAELFNLAGSVVTQWASGGVPAGALAGTAITAAGLLLGIGGLADGLRKDKIIEEQKSQITKTA